MIVVTVPRLCLLDHGSLSLQTSIKAFGVEVLVCNYLKLFVREGFTIPCQLPPLYHEGWTPIPFVLC